jgi:saccharopine dehydrogenase-like NADP-dependent oxidoreductase
MSKHIILFGAGKSASFLIKYLLTECCIYKWRLTVADNNILLAQSKVGLISYAEAKQVQIENEEQRSGMIKEGDLIISLLPPSLHFLVAGDCLMYGKALLTASYLDEKILSLAPDIKKDGLLFLCEMGLDPGIDHMSAMRLVHRIKEQGGEIVSVKSHCGGLLAPESDDNPWHYKISWNSKNIVMAGSSGAIFREKNVINRVAYKKLFYDCKSIIVKDHGQLAYYPNRDSLPYMKSYDLQDIPTFIRTTLRHPAYCAAWNSIVNAGLTDDTTIINSPGLTFKNWSTTLIPFVNINNSNQFDFLGFFDNQIIPKHLKTSADILQYLLEKKLMMQPADKDMIIMLHEIEYYLDNKLYKTNSLLMLKGEDNIYTAMAKTVGLPLGVAASLILRKKMLLTGLHIPILPEIYNPVLNELEKQGISFEENDSVMKEELI